MVAAGNGRKHQLIHFAINVIQHTFQNVHQPLPTGINHTRLLEDSQLVGVRSGLFAPFQHALQQKAQVAALFGGVGGFAGAFANDGEDGAFDRLHDAAVGGVGGGLEGVGQIGGVERFFALEAFGQPAPYLAEDDAGVAARAHERTVGQLFGDLTHVLFFAVLHTAVSRLHRQQHVGAGVAVGYGEDVEGINVLVILLQPGEGRIR